MSTKDPIYCFNGKPSEDKGECTYTECGMYLEEMDICKLEYLKGSPAPVVSKRTQPTASSQEPETQIGGTRLINTLKVGDTSSKNNQINVKGTLKDDPTQRDVDVRGETLTVTNITIEDETGELKIGFWGDMGNEFMDFQKGDKLLIMNVYKVKEPYGGVLQADGGKYYKVSKIN